VERQLKELADRGYALTFGQTVRADKGAIMRGNDLLTGSPHVMGLRYPPPPAIYS